MTLTPLPGDPLPVPNVPNVPTPKPSHRPAQSHSPQGDIPSPPAISLADHLTNPIATDSPVPSVPNHADITGIHSYLLDFYIALDNQITMLDSSRVRWYDD